MHLSHLSQKIRFLNARFWYGRKVYRPTAPVQKAKSACRLREHIVILSYTVGPKHPLNNEAGALQSASARSVVPFKEEDFTGPVSYPKEDSLPLRLLDQMSPSLTPNNKSLLRTDHSANSLGSSEVLKNTSFSVPSETEKGTFLLRTVTSSTSFTTTPTSNITCANPKPLAETKEIVEVGKPILIALGANAQVSVNLENDAIVEAETTNTKLSDAKSLGIPLTSVKSLAIDKGLALPFDASFILAPQKVSPGLAAPTIATCLIHAPVLNSVSLGLGPLDYSKPKEPSQCSSTPSAVVDEIPLEERYSFSTEGKTAGQSKRTFGQASIASCSNLAMAKTQNTGTRKTLIKVNEFELLVEIGREAMKAYNENIRVSNENEYQLSEETTKRLEQLAQFVHDETFSAYSTRLQKLVKSAEEIVTWYRKLSASSDDCRVEAIERQTSKREYKITALNQEIGHMIETLRHDLSIAALAMNAIGDAETLCDYIEEGVKELPLIDDEHFEKIRSTSDGLQRSWCLGEIPSIYSKMVNELVKKARDVLDWHTSINLILNLYGLK